VPVESRNYGCTLALTSSSPSEGGRAKGWRTGGRCGHWVRSRREETGKRVERNKGAARERERERERERKRASGRMKHGMLGGGGGWGTPR